jgi:uncharacterized membrane protein
MHAPRPRDRFHVVVLGPPQYASALNNRGQLVGRLLNAAEGTRGVLHDVNGGSIALGTLGGSFSAARDINDAGVIVGDSLLAGDDVHHGFVCVSGQLFDLNDLLEEEGATCEVLHALSVNDLNEIVAIAVIGGEERTVLLRPASTTRI